MSSSAAEWELCVLGSSGSSRSLAGSVTNAPAGHSRRPNADCRTRAGTDARTQSTRCAASHRLRGRPQHPSVTTRARTSSRTGTEADDVLGTGEGERLRRATSLAPADATRQTAEVSGPAPDAAPWATFSVVEVDYANVAVTRHRVRDQWCDRELVSTAALVAGSNPRPTCVRSGPSTTTSLANPLAITTTSTSSPGGSGGQSRSRRLNVLPARMP